MAAVQQVHASLITRQIRSLEAVGYVEVSVDPGDRRSSLVRLTPAGEEEKLRLREIGLKRFARFLAEWEPGEVQMFTALLEKFQASKTAVAAKEQAPAVRRAPRHT